jgi:hypothetical protein
MPPKKTTAKAAEPAEPKPITAAAEDVAPAGATESALPSAVETETVANQPAPVGETAEGPGAGIGADVGCAADGEGIHAQPAALDPMAFVPEPVSTQPNTIDGEEEQHGAAGAQRAACHAADSGPQPPTAAAATPGAEITADGDDGDQHGADVTPTQPIKKPTKPKTERKRKPPLDADAAKPAAKRSVRSTRSNPLDA